MSHFSVLVIGDDVEGQLAPYHEFECTGLDDEHVQDIDQTNELRAEYAARTEKDYPTFLVYVTDYHGRKALIDGHLPGDDHKYGYALVNEAGEVLKVVDRTNPRAKWDWWVMGGRWTGSLLLKAKTRGIVGRPGLMTERAPVGYADQAFKRDIDFAQQRNDAEAKARILWTETRRITAGESWENWDDTLTRYCGPEGKRDHAKIETARTDYRAQPAIEMLRASKKEAYSWEIDDDLALDLDKFIEIARMKACSHYAFVRDREWTERGHMGWWGMASDEVSPAQWLRQFNDMLDAIPDDTLLTVIDCHI